MARKINYIMKWRQGERTSRQSEQKWDSPLMMLIFKSFRNLKILKRAGWSVISISYPSFEKMEIMWILR